MRAVSLLAFIIMFIAFSALAQTAVENTEEERGTACSIEAARQLPKQEIPCSADERICGAWRNFRLSHPAPYEAFAATADLGEGERVIILSEPAPSLSRDQAALLVSRVFSGTDATVERLKYPTGLDGWLEDIVVKVRAAAAPQSSVPDGRDAAMTLPASIADRLIFLHMAMYRTLDGFYVEPVTTEATVRPYVKDLSVSAAEVDVWIRDKNLRWRNPSQTQSATEKSWREIVSSGRPDVWLSSNGALVALLVTPKFQPDELELAFRRFAIASDILLGSIGLRGGGMFLLGRNRQVPLADLPPLRAETFMAMLANRGKPIVQSYERQRIFAGKIREGTYKDWDWAPINLSPQLEDSDFGTVLNLADQILKSWSECNRVVYRAFDYTARETYPFDDEPASEVFSVFSPSLIFNWNTQAFSTVAELPVGKVLSPYRTGALPVSYIVPELRQHGRPSSDSPLAEEADFPQFLKGLQQEVTAGASRAGTDYFAKSGDPILARVVQYVMLLQSTNEFMPKARQEGAAKQSRYDRVVSLLRQRAGEWIKTIDQPQSAARNPALAEALRGAVRGSGISAARLAELLSTPEAATRDILRLEQEYRARSAVAKQIVTARIDLQLKMEEEESKGLEGFKHWCRSRAGQISDTDNGYRCRYRGTSKDAGDAYRDEHTDFIARSKPQLERYLIDLNMAKKRLDDISDHHERIARELLAAETAADLIKFGATYQVDLDTILGQVLEAGAQRPTEGPIRTPTVVLSRNVGGAFSIGGHNIDAQPWLARPTNRSAPLLDLKATRPTIEVPGKELGNSTAIARAAIAGIQRSEAGNVIRSPQEALALRTNASDESLLAKMRDIMLQKDPAPTEVLRNAELCECDVYIERLSGEISSIVKVKPPPPVARHVVGTSQVVEQLAGLGRQSRIVMSGFSPETVNAIGQSAVLMAKPPPRGAVSEVFKTIADSARKLFNAERANMEVLDMSTPTVRSTVSVERRLGEKQMRLAANLRAKQRWSDAKVEALRRENLPASTSLVQLTFNRLPNKPLSVESIEILMNMGDTAAPSDAKVISTVKNEVRKLGNADLAIRNGVSRLLNAVQRDLNPREVHFMVKEGPGIIVRIAPPEGNRIALLD